MEIKFLDIVDDDRKSFLCNKIISNLPLWFGLPESNIEYCSEVKKHRFIAINNGESEIGFVSLKKNTEFVVEVFVMGLSAAYHRQGIGKKMMDYICGDLRKNGIKFLEVKTLDESAESEEYRKTRLFYRNVGFIPLDVLKNEWGEANPCLIMIKNLQEFPGGFQ